MIKIYLLAMLYLLMKQKGMIYMLKDNDADAAPGLSVTGESCETSLSRGHLEMQNELSASTGSSIFLLVFLDTFHSFIVLLWIRTTSANWI
jgi:hypothetical protein